MSIDYNSLSLPDAVAYYAAHGVPIVPVDEHKVARIKGWAEPDYRADPAHWQQWPDANIGWVMGHGNLIAIDEDGPVGRRSIAELEARLGPLPPTLESRSGRLEGGRGLIFVWPGDDLPRNSVGKLAPGVDIRSRGGLLVVAPSVHKTGNRYQWTGQRDPVELPTAWADALRALRPSPSAAQDGDRPETAVALADRVARAAAIVAEAAPAISGKGGHTATFVLAQRVVRGCILPTDVALEVMRPWNERCEPPWSDAELHHKIEEAETRGEFAWGDELDEAKVAAPSRLTLAQRVVGFGKQGTRLATGLPTLDRATRGGLLVGRVVAIGGAPGACKTGLVTDLGRRWARDGAHVAILATDEDADGICMRIAQAEGFARDALEAGDSAVLQAAAARLEAGYPTLTLVDGEEDGATVEDVADALAARAPAGAARILVVDSLQTARIRNRPKKDSRREEIDAVVAALKSVAKRYGMLVLVTSELARGAYRSRQSSERIDDLAAAKESGGIEYGVAVLLVLRSVTGDGSLVDVTMPKNRLGPKFEFRLELDPIHATLREVAKPEGGGPASRYEQLKARILDAVRKAANPLKSKNAIARAVGGNKSEVLEAVDELVAIGLVTLTEVGFCGAVPIGSNGLEPVSEPA